MEIEEMEGRVEPLPPSLLTVAVAVNGNKSSKHALKWALEKFTPEGIILFRLLYVRPKITMVPTPMGNYLPISKVRDDVASAYRKEIEWQTNSMFLPYTKMCRQKQVEAEALVIEADDVAEGISEEVNKYTINKLVIGVSCRNIFTRKFKGSKMSSRISEHTPSFCTVYIVSRGKLSLVRASTSGTAENARSACIPSIPSYSNLSHSSSARSEEMNSRTSSNCSLPRLSSLSSQRSQALKVINQSFSDRRSVPREKLNHRILSLSTDEYFMSCASSVSEMQSSNNNVPSDDTGSQSDRQSLNCDQASTSDAMPKISPSKDDINVEIELERLRIELRHLQGIYEIAQNEAFDASQQLDDWSARCKEEANRFSEISIREAQAREMVIKEREIRESAEREAEYIKKCAENEALRRKNAEDTAVNEAIEKQRLEKALASSNEQYKYNWEEIKAATSSFSDALKIGSGANGTVYKASFNHTVAAVKILHSNEGRATKQFKQELEILGTIRHPHLLLLLGACVDHGCLVYEYMENGSLDDRLQRKNNTPSLPWYHRFRIAYEIASALVFLHSSKPDPIIHRDLKPANILLDSNFVSKIGDVGLSTLLPSMNFTMSAAYKDTAPAGTFFYIDPEYQRTGLLSAKSDTYALGMVICQLLTGKPPMGLADRVETALEGGFLVDVLDSEAGQWPTEETQELALLGLGCLELRRKDRPELKSQVLPLLQRLKDFADNARDFVQRLPSVPPSHFICPILQEVMEDPCVASDGYTYDRAAIEKWFTMNDKSPMTNVRLSDKNLIANQSLLSAIKDWECRS